VDGDGVGFVADLELKGERGAAEDLEGSRVGGGERWVGGWGANKNERGGKELCWQGRGRGGCRRLGKGARKGRLQISEKMKGIILRWERKLCRKNKRGSKSCFCRGKIGFFMRSGTKGKKKPWQMAYPVRRGTAGA
jgi:hypothetical protein